MTGGTPVVASNGSAGLETQVGNVPTTVSGAAIATGGVDGGNSVGASAVGALEYDLGVVYNESCIGTSDKNKELKYREKLAQNRKCEFTMEV